MDSKPETAEPKIISTIDMLYHEEFLCLSKSPDGRWLLDIRIYDCSDHEISEFTDEETGDVNLPDEIDGIVVIGIDETSQAILVDRLIPHLNDDIAKLRYQFTEFDWQTFTKIFGKLFETLCVDQVKKDIAAAVSRSG